MKIIIKIAKNELLNLFYSPVAWFLVIAFMVQCGLYYTGNLYTWANLQDLYLKNIPSWKNWGTVSVTQETFLGGDGIFVNVLTNLFLFIPLLCMGLISREINNGTIKLLYSSPVKVRDIVLGKYLAIMLFNLLLLAILGIFMVSGAFNIKSVDYGLLLSASLGFYLMVCAFTAIGLFLSSLTTYPIVSAIGTFITLFILSRIGGLWQKYDFLRDLTNFLSMSGRTVKMLKGLITTKDILYFVLIVYLFLSFTYFKLKGTREAGPWYIKARGYLVVSVLVLGFGYLGSLPAYTLYWDATARQANTIDPKVQQMIRDMGKDKLEVTLYTNLLGKGGTAGLPEARNAYLSTMWEPYVRFKPDIDFNYSYYYAYHPWMDDSVGYKSFAGKSVREMADLMAHGMEVSLSKFMPEEEMVKTTNLAPENFRLVMQLKYNGQSTFLRTFDDGMFWPNEMQVAAALKRLQQARMPKLLFVTGDLERSIYKHGEREYQLHTLQRLYRVSLINLGFDADSVNLETQDIPAGITALVLADPKKDLSAVSQAKIRQYIDGGGNMLILGEPGKQYVLNPVLQELGVQLKEGILVEPSKEEMPHMVKPYLTAAFSRFADEPEFIEMREGGKSLKGLMPGAAAVSVDRPELFNVSPLLASAGDKTWLKAGKLVTDSTPPEFSPKEGDIKGPFPTAVALTRHSGDHEQKIIVCGDADFLSNLRSGGGSIGRAIYSWLDDNKFPIYTPKEQPKDNLLLVTPGGAAAEKIVYVWVLPAITLLIGTILLIRRKRK
ncbi:Gldg family protein [Puia sp. P3]|uniref:Gldg family protein n=1 Tax=Puia sp. P3 TaxID=3423952 RepID=UPI003D66BB9C